jgi:hypothetical protein
MPPGRLGAIRQRLRLLRVVISGSSYFQVAAKGSQPPYLLRLGLLDIQQSANAAAAIERSPPSAVVPLV